MICKNCGNEIAEGMNNCPYCSTPIESAQAENINNSNSYYSNVPNGQYTQSFEQSQYNQPPYGQSPYGQPPYGQPPYGQPPYGQPPYGQNGAYPPPPPPSPMDMAAKNEVSSAKTFGFVALIASFFIPLVAWICGGIAISKVNPYLNYGGFIGADANEAKRYAKIGIIIGIVKAVLSVAAVIVYFVFLGIAFKDSGIAEEFYDDFMCIANIFIH